jgi:hypothetical protein
MDSKVAPASPAEAIPVVPCSSAAATSKACHVTCMAYGAHNKCHGAGLAYQVVSAVKWRAVAALVPIYAMKGHRASLLTDPHTKPEELRTTCCMQSMPQLRSCSAR